MTIYSDNDDGDYDYADDTQNQEPVAIQFVICLCNYSIEFLEYFSAINLMENVALYY